MKHPIQKVAPDAHGVLRFVKNEIVRHLLDKGGLSLNDLACEDFSREDHEQFAMLIGYSVSGFGDLSYTRPEIEDAVYSMVEKGTCVHEARAEIAEQQLEDLRETLRDPMAKLFSKHPDDFLLD